jgi:hypothetical protein
MDLIGIRIKHNQYMDYDSYRIEFGFSLRCTGIKGVFDEWFACCSPLHIWGIYALSGTRKVAFKQHILSQEKLHNIIEVYSYFDSDINNQGSIIAKLYRHRKHWIKAFRFRQNDSEEFVQLHHELALTKRVQFPHLYFTSSRLSNTNTIIISLRYPNPSSESVRLVIIRVKNGRFMKDVQSPSSPFVRWIHAYYDCTSNQLILWASYPIPSTGHLFSSPFDCNDNPKSSKTLRVTIIKHKNLSTSSRISNFFIDKFGTIYLMNRKGPSSLKIYGIVPGLGQKNI